MADRIQFTPQTAATDVLTVTIETARVALLCAPGSRRLRAVESAPHAFALKHRCFAIKHSGSMPIGCRLCTASGGRGCTRFGPFVARVRPLPNMSKPWVTPSHKRSQASISVGQEEGCRSYAQIFGGLAGIAQVLRAARGRSRRYRQRRTIFLGFQRGRRVALAGDMTARRKNPHAMALGRLGGLKGGRARAEKLSARRRREIARRAAQARWRQSRVASVSPAP
jgi:hypothetical protein